MRAGLLRYRIRFYARVSERDEDYNSYTETWPVATVSTRGRIRFLSGSRTTASDVEFHAGSLELTIRYRSGITTDMKVRINDDLDFYAINYIDPYTGPEGLRLYIEKTNEICPLDTPTNLIATWVNDYASITFTDKSGGNCQHEIWSSRDGINYVLDTTLNAGVTSYNDYTWQGTTVYFKIRAKYRDAYSEYTTPISLDTYLTLKVTATSGNLTVSPYNINVYTYGHTIIIYWGDNQMTNVTAVGGVQGFTHTYASAGTYYVTIRGDKQWLNYLEWYNDSTHLAGTDVGKWIFPQYFEFGHLYNNGLIGDLSDIEYPALAKGIHFGNNPITANITSWSLPTEYWDLHVASDDYSKITGDISGWVVPDRLAHVNIYGYVSGDLTDVVPYVDATYGSVLLQIYSTHPTGFYGDLSQHWAVPDKPGTLIATGGCHFTGLPRGSYRYITIFNFSGNSCDQEELDSFLGYLDNYFTTHAPAANCVYTLNGTGMGIPSATGLAAKASIQSKYTAAGYSATININS